MRSITHAATLFCAWSSTRYKEAMTWAKKAWLHKTIHGGIPCSRVQNAIWPLLLNCRQLEHNASGNNMTGSEPACQIETKPQTNDAAHPKNPRTLSAGRGVAALLD